MFVKVMHWTIAVCLVVLAVDTDRVPGFYTDLFRVGYLAAAVGIIGWSTTRRYEWLRIFTVSLFVCSWARAAAFVIWERHRLSGIALNVCLACIAVLWVERGGRDHVEQLG